MIERTTCTPADPPYEVGRPPALLSLLLAADQVAELLGLSVRSIKRLSSEGTLPGVVRIGRSVRFSRAALEEWVGRGCPPAKGPRRRAVLARNGRRAVTGKG
jgi:excisionase family DNA binding protein